jgi:hypothetical protein
MRAPWLAWLSLATAAGCTDEPVGKDPATAERAPIDRFSPAAGTWYRRDVDPSLPAPNAAIDYDARFKLLALGPAGQHVTMYLFDVQATAPAPIYVFYRAGESAPVAGQKTVVSVIPGDPGYTDLWQVVRVEVPGDYVANTITSLAEIVDHGLTQTPTSALVNCPLVPEGSTATVRTPGDYPELTQGWYGGRIIQYFHFGERPSLATVADAVPTSTLYVAYVGNQPGAAFVTEPGSAQTHAVTATIPSDPTYAPLWSVHAYDAAAFATVGDLASAMAAPGIATPAAIVNAPIARVAP